MYCQRSRGRKWTGGARFSVLWPPEIKSQMKGPVLCLLSEEIKNKVTHMCWDPAFREGKRSRLQQRSHAARGIMAGGRFRCWCVHMWGRDGEEEEEGEEEKKKRKTRVRWGKSVTPDHPSVWSGIKCWECLWVLLHTHSVNIKLDRQTDGWIGAALVFTKCCVWRHWWRDILLMKVEHAL